MTAADKRLLPLTVRDLRYSAGGTDLVRGVSFEISAGTRTIIMGPNGAGKSLTLRLCHGLLAPTAGTIAWNGQTGQINRSRRHAMVFQRPVMLRRSARANITHALAVTGIHRSARHFRADEALERFGLTDLAERPARRLSGGEQQRLAIARAWALRPEVLFLDEPTSALDPAATKAIEDMVQIIHDAGTKVIMTTHDLGQARRLADEVLFLHHGRLVEHAPADRFFSNATSPDARAFLAGDLLW